PAEAHGPRRRRGRRERTQPGKESNEKSKEKGHYPTSNRSVDLWRPMVNKPRRNRCAQQDHRRVTQAIASAARRRQRPGTELLPLPWIVRRIHVVDGERPDSVDLYRCCRVSHEEAAHLRRQGGSPAGWESLHGRLVELLSHAQRHGPG